MVRSLPGHDISVISATMPPIKKTFAEKQEDAVRNAIDAAYKKATAILAEARKNKQCDLDRAMDNVTSLTAALKAATSKMLSKMTHDVKNRVQYAISAGTSKIHKDVWLKLQRLSWSRVEYDSEDDAAPAPEPVPQLCRILPHLATLGLGPDRATEADVRAAFMRLVLVVHPDKKGGSCEAFNIVRDAYDAVMATFP